MGKMIDMSGKKIGRLTVIERSNASGTNKGVYWLCQCKCGAEKYIRGADLRDGSIVSCGCYKNENTSERSTKHGMSDSLIYDVWKSMKARCFRESCKDYPDYGGRGITVCSEWEKRFQSFYNGR